MRSDRVKKGPQRAPSRALLYACGVDSEDIYKKPFIGIASSYTDVVPGHVHMERLKSAIEKGIYASGGISFTFGTPAICDGIAMGHKGMNYSLPSRELIADCVETMAQAHGFDGLVLLTSCDKITPGMLMAAARLNIPSIVVTAGPMLAGRKGSKRLSLVRDTFEAVGNFEAGNIKKDELEELTLRACPGAGSCQGLYTANTMNCLTEAMGMSLPGAGTSPAVSAKKERLAYRRRLTNHLRDDGFCIIATFDENGPLRCSGLPVVRYSIEELEAQFNDEFQLLTSLRDDHKTPAGRTQSFVFALFQKR